MKSWARENVALLERLADKAALRQRLERAFYVNRLLRKFDPNQPRVPAGNSDGGQWTSDGGSASLDALGISADFWNQCTALAASGASMDECVNQCLHLLIRPQPPGSDRNEFDFRKCLNRCLGINQ